ncbi:MAG: UrcA family protein [Pseudomonadota bacterium]
MSYKTYLVAAFCGALALAFAPASHANSKYDDSFQFSYTVGDVIQVEKQDLVAKRLEREANRFCRHHVGFGRAAMDRTYCRNTIVKAVNRAIKKRYPEWKAQRSKN